MLVVGAIGFEEEVDQTTLELLGSSESPKAPSRAATVMLEANQAMRSTIEWNKAIRALSGPPSILASDILNSPERKNEILWTTVISWKTKGVNILAERDER